MKNKKIILNFIWIGVLIIASIWIIAEHNKNIPYKTINGLVFGTVYNITYQSEDSLQDDIEATFRQFDGSLSMFNDTSIISRINQNKTVVTDSIFNRCFKKATEISQLTNGDFDITVCPLVNAWGFGFKSRQFPSKKQIDSLLQYIGYQKVKLVNNRIIKSNPHTMLDCSAIAKGYAVDLVSELLLQKGVKNFMVDIGGEVVIKGQNPQHSLWRIGINKPTDDSLSMNQDIDRVLYISNKAIATSGNYRNFYYHNGKKYSHEINPHTGQPAMNEVLSSTVIADDCMTADALATSIMVMGLKKAQTLISKLHNVETYIIYRGDNGKSKIYFSKGMNKYLKNE
jgi:thiamine biosynthesis lipoprotein